MGLNDISSSTAILKAVEEFDRLGRNKFLGKYSFGKARSYFLVISDKDYDSKAIVGVAHGYEFPDQGPLKSSDFSGGAKTVERKLKQLGFNVIVKQQL